MTGKKVPHETSHLAYEVCPALRQPLPYPLFCSRPVFLGDSAWQVRESLRTRPVASTSSIVPHHCYRIMLTQLHGMRILTATVPSRRGRLIRSAKASLPVPQTTPHPR